jgi:hypothetical protein
MRGLVWDRHVLKVLADFSADVFSFLKFLIFPDVYAGPTADRATVVRGGQLRQYSPPLDIKDPARIEEIS